MTTRGANGYDAGPNKPSSGAHMAVLELQGHPVTHRTADVGGARIHWVECGTGPVALMVHGFPESWYSWRNQLPALAAAGYRAVAMDVRGYGRSSKPRVVDEYRMVRMVSDGPTIWGRPSIDRFGETLPQLTRCEILPGCGHWTQQERPEATNALLIEFLNRIH
jgi:pimeloyl-ACP methyl ester carboxylesterase